MEGDDNRRDFEVSYNPAPGCRRKNNGFVLYGHSPRYIPP
jgi:hypothetical protein